MRRSGGKDNSLWLAVYDLLAELSLYESGMVRSLNLTDLILKYSDAYKDIDFLAIEGVFSRRWCAGDYVFGDTVPKNISS